MPGTIFCRPGRGISGAASSGLWLGSIPGLLAGGAWRLSEVFLRSHDLSGGVGSRGFRDENSERIGHAEAIILSGGTNRLNEGEMAFVWRDG